MESYKTKLEILYRKDCCVQCPNDSCGNCEKGKNSECLIYNVYMSLYKVVGRLDPIPVKHVVGNHGVCPNCMGFVNYSYHHFCPDCGQALDWSDE